MLDAPCLGGLSCFTSTVYMNDQSEVAATPGGEQDEFTELAGHGSLSLRVQS